MNCLSPLIAPGSARERQLILSQAKRSPDGRLAAQIRLQPAIQENGVLRKSQIEPVVLLTPALRPAKVPWGNCRVSCSGQSSRGQFQIGKAPLRSRRLRGESLTLSSLATHHSSLATAFAYSSHPVSRIPAMLMKAKGIIISTRHTMSHRSFVTNHQPALSLPDGLPVTNHCLSLAASSVEATRYTLQTRLAVTHSKQTTAVLSNRYEKPPPAGVTSWLPKAGSTDDGADGARRKFSPSLRSRRRMNFRMAFRRLVRNHDRQRKDRDATLCQTIWPGILGGAAAERLSAGAEFLCGGQGAFR